MPEITPTAPQAGLMDELKADPLRQTADSAIVAKKPDGELVEITAEGEVKPFTEDQPEPIPATDLVPVDATDADEFKPDATDLLVADLDDLPRAMDRADEVMILDEIQGRALANWVYSFEVGGKLQTDLTVHGVNECVRVLNERGGTKVGVSKDPPLIDQFTEGEERYYRALVYAEDRRTGVGNWGIAIEPSKVKGKWDKFAQTKALNKAERNALKKHIPDEFRQVIIAQAIGKGRVQVLKPLGLGMPKDERPVLTDERAQELKAEIREAFVELKKLNRLAIKPGQYNSMLFGAERDSHERLEETLETINSAIAVEEEAKAKRGAENA